LLELNQTEPQLDKFLTAQTKADETNLDEEEDEEQKMNRLESLYNKEDHPEEVEIEEEMDYNDTNTNEFEKKKEKPQYNLSLLTKEDILGIIEMEKEKQKEKQKQKQKSNKENGKKASQANLILKKIISNKFVANDED